MWIFFIIIVRMMTPLEETMGALDGIVRQGKALYIGLSNINLIRRKKPLPFLQLTFIKSEEITENLILKVAMLNKIAEPL